MSQSYCMVGSMEDLKCSKKDFEELKSIWNGESEGYDEEGFAKDSDGFDVCLVDGNKLYIFADEFGDYNNIPEAVLKKIGEIVKKAKMPYLTFSFSFSNSKNLQGSQGGGEFRVYPDGEMEFPELKYKR